MIFCLCDFCEKEVLVKNARIVRDSKGDIYYHEGCYQQFLANLNIANVYSYKEEEEKKGIKYDDNKSSMELVDPFFMERFADVLTYGKKKYAVRNWEKGLSWGRVFAALMRHLWKWWGGRKYDKESGHTHLAHAACCVMFLSVYEDRATGTDDRPYSSVYKFNFEAKEEKKE